MTTEERHALNSKMRKGECRGEHYGDYWTPNDDKKLGSLFEKGYDYCETAVELGRSELSVINRCAKLKLYNRSRKTYERHKCTGCLCSSCSEYSRCRDQQSEFKND